MEDERKTKAQLIKELTYFRAAMDATSDAIGISTPEGQHFYSNDASIKLFGWEPGDFEHHQPSIAYADQKVAEKVFATIMAGDSWIGEVEMMAKDGRRFPSFLRAHAVRNAKGEIIALMGTHTDITDRKRAEKEKLALERQVQQAQKLESLGVLAGGIAHDFNNLLMCIQGNTELVLEGITPEDPAWHRILDIETTTKRATDLTKQMLAYSGKGRFEIKRIDIEAIIQEMVDLLNVSISKKVIIKYDFARDLPRIEADPTQIRQIIMNLVVNASESIGNKSGAITIRSGAMECDRSYLDKTFLDDNLAEGPYAYFEFSDTGAGMDEKTIARIFDPFYSTKFQGRGLGLAAVLGIVRSHKGAIEVSSKPDKGSTFKILFPIGTDEPILSEKHEQQRLDSRKLADKTALLVDDEQMVRRVIRQILEQLGLKVTTAVDGQDALRLFKPNPDQFDFIILDFSMPHMDGEETFLEMSRIRKDVCVVLSSGYNEQDLVARSASIGFAGFIQKPCSIADIEEVLLKASNIETPQ